ncbi:MAG: 50S ribosomal protein L6 [Crenarchaeota archaeon]|nr:50S ribosomal protein L6 [Thermoproteota archaeon]MDA1124337.1 50S ribosomal protein L6 [Thermoproteota archaeon]
MSTSLINKMATELEIPKGVTITYKKSMITVQGPLGKTWKSFKKIPVTIDVTDGKVLLKAQGTRDKSRAIMNTSRSLIRNLCEGVVEGYTIKMKIVFSHFPITVKVEGKTVIIENFQGERGTRKTKIWGETKVLPKGDDVIITGHVLTDVSQTAAEIQNGSKVKDKDHRVFLDGIYKFEKKKGIEN